MTTYSLTVRSDHFAELAQALLRDDGCEHAAYVLCAHADIRHEPWDRQAHRKFLSRKIIPVPDEHIVESTPNLVTWRTASFARALKEAQADGMTVAVAHSHPAGQLLFSEQDDKNEPDLLQMAMNRNGDGSSILSLILTADQQLAGRIWLHPSERGKQPLRVIRVYGTDFAYHYPERSTGVSPVALHRQALALGHALNRDLRMLRVGIVGCGGTGSAVAMLLARLGIGQIVLFDNDIIDQTNLNRLHGARQADADAMRPKVNVVADVIAEMGLGVRVVPIEAWVGDPQCRDALRSCDIVLSCTDDHDGRLFLNRFAYYYVIPVIDLGLAIDVDHGEPPTIKAFDGRVTVLGPKHTCLLCRGVIDPEIARAEAMRRDDPAEYEKRKAESYVLGEGNPSPAVVTFTTELACMAVNELIHRLQGFRGPEGAAANRVRKFHLNEDRRPGHRPESACPICASETIWGRGDQQPFMGRVD
jgi:molybdopterin/thiamine biosynthesis adenylyltransferase